MYLTYLHGVEKNKEKGFVDYINFGTTRNSWGIFQSNSFNDLKVVSGNIVETSFFALAVCLATIGRVEYVEKSADLFKELDQLLQNRVQDEDFPNLKIVQKQVARHLSEVYTHLAIYYSTENKQIEKIEPYLKMAIEKDSQNFTANIELARINWVKKDILLAKYNTNLASKINKRSNLVKLNRAFFMIHERKYERAMKEYKRVKSVTGTNIVRVIEFIEQEFEKQKNNPGFLFAAAFLNIKFADKSRGEEQMRECKELIRDNVEYRPLLVD